MKMIQLEMEYHGKKRNVSHHVQERLSYQLGYDSMEKEGKEFLDYGKSVFSREGVKLHNHSMFTVTWFGNDYHSHDYKRYTIIYNYRTSEYGLEVRKFDKDYSVNNIIWKDTFDELATTFRHMVKRDMIELMESVGHIV